MQEDIRWKQRFENYKKALKALIEAVELSLERELSNLEKQGLIQSFEFTYELGWTLLKDYLIYQGNPDIKGSRDTIRNAYKIELIVDGDIWMDMINSRNVSSHTYNEAVAEDIIKKIKEYYMDAFESLEVKMTTLVHE